MQFIIQCTSIQANIVGMLKKMVGFHRSETCDGEIRALFLTRSKK